jgi:hypothetical protein
MRRVFASMLMLAMIAMPLSGVAFKAPASSEMQDMPCHTNGPDQASPGLGGGCDSCGTAHICCIAFMAPASVAVSPVTVSAHRIRFGDRHDAGIVPDPLDPPPLAL